MFIDFAKISLKAGKGGQGCVSFRREKFVPKGGPDGGDGGKGGNIYFLADSQIQTLLDFRYKKNYKSQNGVAGQGSRKAGKAGEDLIIKVPIGTIIKNLENNEIIADLKEESDKILVAKGGIGGKGNCNFATPTNQAPRYAQPGLDGENLEVELELKLLADVGLVGFPNAGKSTFLSRMTAAKPKIADYPFTTLQPNLGIVRYKDYQSFVIADIPGLIEGAHEGKGLGIQFLRHVERTKVLLYMIDVNAENPEEEFLTLQKELEEFNPKMLIKPKLIVLTKSDTVFEEISVEAKEFQKKYKAILISSATGEKVEQLTDKIWEKIQLANRMLNL